MAEKNKKAKFFCEYCNHEVDNDATFCPFCGRFFSSVKCPNCGYTGNHVEFINGCPKCGYAMGAKPSLNEFTHKRGKRDDSLPFWIYIIAAFLLVILLLIIIKYV